jgi:ribosomal protein S27AE
MTSPDAARSRIQVAIYRGQISRPSKCSECGREYRPQDANGFIVAHHDDYSKPYDIRWLCKKCHFKLHSALRIASGKRIKADGRIEEVRPRHVFKYSLKYINK